MTQARTEYVTCDGKCVTGASVPVTQPGTMTVRCRNVAAICHGKISNDLNRSSLVGDAMTLSFYNYIQVNIKERGPYMGGYTRARRVTATRNVVGGAAS